MAGRNAEAAASEAGMVHKLLLHERHDDEFRCFLRFRANVTFSHFISNSLMILIYLARNRHKNPMLVHLIFAGKTFDFVPRVLL